MQLVSTLQVGNQWVTQCAWTLWKSPNAQTGTYDPVTQIRSHIRSPAASILACGMSNGDVILIDVTQKLLLAPPGSFFGLEVTMVIRNEKAAVANKRMITAMRWVSRQDDIVSCVVPLAIIYRSCQIADPCLL